MSPGTKVFLAVFGLLVGALVLYYATQADDAPGPVNVQNPQRTLEDPLHASATAATTTTTTAPPQTARPPSARPASPLSASVNETHRASLGSPTPPISNGRAADTSPRPEPPLHALTNATLVGAGVGAGPDDGAAPTPPPAPETVPYTVRKGETMSSIARDWFGSATKWHLIAEVNPYVDPTRMRDGIVLQLPAKAAGRPRAASEPAPAAPSRNTYVVKSGDTLSTIAKKVLGSAARWREIHDANRATIGPDPDDLDLGMTLVIPPR